MSCLAYAQLDVKFGDLAANCERISQLVAEASDADLLVFPELATTGYEFMDKAEVVELSEPFPDGPTTRLLRVLAATHRTTLVVGYAERTAEGCYNACMLARPDGAVFNYRKAHLYDREREWFLPGDAPAPVIETPAGRVGLMICFDWFFPELARGLALSGAQVLAHPSNLVLPWCQRAMFARSVENRVFSVTANRVGTEARAGRTLTFTGASQILAPDGHTLVHAPAEGEHVGVAPADISDANNKRVSEFSDLFAARRPELYDALVRRGAERGSHE